MELLGRHLFNTIVLLFLGISNGCQGLSYAISKVAEDRGFMQINVSEKGLNFVKYILVQQALQSLVPLQIPAIKKSLYVPLIAHFNAEVYNSSIVNVEVPVSSIQLGTEGINIITSEVEVNLTMQWKYYYTTWLVPYPVSDEGRASVTIEGMEVGITLKLDEQNGSLYLITMDCGTYLKDIAITLDGGASWFYQGFVDAFEGEIRAAVENAVTSKIKEGIMKLNSLLQNLPKEIGVDSNVAMNFTVMQAPDVGPKSISIGVEGLFVSMTPNVQIHRLSNLQPGISCSGPSKMMEIALSETVLNSAAEVYTHEGLLSWLVDKLPEQSLLNTASWRFIIPKLYKMYPNDDMKLNISVSSPPIITITSEGVDAVVIADMIIDVMDGGDTIPVACVSMTISANGLMDVSGNNIIGEANLQNLALKLKWSNVGDFHMRFIQAIVQTIVKDVLLPLVNVQLKKGFPLPIIRNFRVQNADVIYHESQLIVCTDVQYAI